MLDWLPSVDRSPLQGADLRETHARALEGDHDAQARMVGAVSGLIVREAIRCSRLSPDHEPEDLCQRAAIDLIRLAIPGFDPDRAKWSTYAIHWIRAACRGTVERNRLLRVPAHRVREAQQTGPEALAELRSIASGVSLDAERTEGATLHACIPDATAPDLDELLDLDEARRQAVAAATFIPPRLAYVFLLRLSGRTLQDIGDRLGFSREYVRQLEQRSIAMVDLELYTHAAPLHRCPGWRLSECPSPPELEVGLCRSCWGSLEGHLDIDQQQALFAG